jgi:hypothetical protein
MLSLDFDKKFPKVSRRIALFLIVVAILCVLIAFIYPRLISKDKMKEKNNNVKVIEQ